VPGGEIGDLEVEENPIRVRRRAPNPVVEVEGEAEATPLEIDEALTVRAGPQAQNFGIKPLHFRESGLTGVDQDANHLRP
jgi:hypothetical protein